MPATLAPAGAGPAATETDPWVDYVPALLARLGDDDKVVVRHEAGDLTGAGLAGLIRGAAHRLHQQKIGPGSMVAILTAPNVPGMLVARYAAHLLGATVVHIRSMNPRTDTDELPIAEQAQVLRVTGAQILLSDPQSRSRATELIDATGVQNLELDGAVALAAPPTTAIQPDRCAVVDFTSGTTNAPRLVRHSFRVRGALLRRLAGDVPPARTRLLSVTPISHTTAPMVDVALLQRGTVELHQGFEADEVLRAFAAGVTDVYLAVPHLCALLDHPELDQLDTRGLRRVIYSGTPTARRRVAHAAAVFGPALVQVYGSTETGGICALTAADHAEPLLHTTVGQPFPWVEVSLRDPATGEDAGSGEVWVRSDTCFEGYWNSDGQPRRPDWVATGDLGTFDEHGRLRLLGRVGGVLKVGGLKIYPTAIEAAMLEHPAVREAVVQGVCDADRREQIHAVVALAPGACATEAELTAHVIDRLSPVHAPTQLVFWSGIPLLSSGKPDRRLIRQLVGA